MWAVTLVEGVKVAPVDIIVDILIYIHTKKSMLCSFRAIPKFMENVQLQPHNAKSYFIT